MVLARRTFDSKLTGPFFETLIPRARFRPTALKFFARGELFTRFESAASRRAVLLSRIGEPVNGEKAAVEMRCEKKGKQINKTKSTEEEFVRDWRAGAQARALAQAVRGNTRRQARGVFIYIARVVAELVSVNCNAFWSIHDYIMK